MAATHIPLSAPPADDTLRPPLKRRIRHDYLVLFACLLGVCGLSVISVIRRLRRHRYRGPERRRKPRARHP